MLIPVIKSRGIKVNSPPFRKELSKIFLKASDKLFATIKSNEIF
jgi:hypothetical protein